MKIRKIFFMLLIVGTFGLCGCNDSSNQEEAGKNMGENVTETPAPTNTPVLVQESTQIPVPELTVTPEPTATPTPTSTPTPTEVPEVVEPTPTEAPVAEAKSFPVEVTYMFDCGRYREERALSWYDGVSYEPYLTTKTFATFADFLSAPDPYDTMNSSTYKEDLCFNICNPRNNASFSYDDIKVLVEAIDPAYIELTEDKDLTPFSMGPSFEAELLASQYLSYHYVEEEKYEEVIVDGVDNSYTYTDFIRVNTKPVDYYVSTITERSTGKEFVWGVQFVLEDVDNPGTYYNKGYLYWDFYNTFISNPLEY